MLIEGRRDEFVKRALVISGSTLHDEWKMEVVKEEADMGSDELDTVWVSQTESLS